MEAYSYDVFGAPTLHTAPGLDAAWLTPDDTTAPPPAASTIANPYRFTARRYDPETGLYHYRARYYDPTTGRFLQPDPISYDDGMNLYAYVGNNPKNWVDPFGTRQNTTLKSDSPLYSGAAALFNLRFENGQREKWRLHPDSGGRDMVLLLIRSQVTGNRITELEYIGHGDVNGGIGWTDASNRISGIYGEDVIGSNKRDAFTVESLETIIKDAMVPNATVEFRGCYTARGSDSIAARFKAILPDAHVYGYTGPAIVEFWFGTNWGRENSEFVEVELSGEECK